MASTLYCNTPEDITEQHRNLNLLEESRKQQARIIDNLPTGIIVFKIENGSYEILQVNPAVCRMMQIDAQKAIGQKDEALLQLAHPQDIETIRSAMAEMKVPGAEIHYEYRNLNRETGGYRWTSADGKSEQQPDGSIYVYIGYQDITARKEKEEEYQHRIEILAEMDDENLIAKGRHNLTKNQVIAYSPKTGYAATVQANSSYDAAVAALAEQVMTSEKRAEIRTVTAREDLLRQFARGKTDGAVEFRRRMPDHTALWTVVKYNLFEEPETHDIMAFMYSYDITDRVRENRILAKISSMEYDIMGLIDTRTHGYTIIAQRTNGRPLMKTGDFDTAVAKRIAEMASPAEQDALRRQVRVDAVLEQLRDKPVDSVMYSLRDEAGQFLRKRLQFSYLDDEEETVMFFRSDITEMYEKEQEQLRKIESALQAANQANLAKTEFFSRMSHDMRTPMNGILGLAELSRDEDDPAALKTAMQKIHESGQYLLGLINDTLDFQRIESGRLKLEPQIVNAAELVENTVDMIRQTAEAKGVRLKVKNSNADLNWYVRVDPMRMKQVFLNLLSNAVKFTPAEGTVELEFRILGREGLISHDLVTVRDTGIGMSEEFLRTGIFRPFSQESNAVTAQYAGSGLGLSIAKSLVELMGGHIEVESEPGVGTTFSVYIDFERVPREEVDSAMQNNRQRSKEIRHSLKGKHMLLVEDHPLNAEIAMRLLKKAGCTVDWMQNGAEAVACFEAGDGARYDLVLMDIRMPVMDGLEAAKRIRATEQGGARRVPIIAMTANAYEEDVRNSLQAGMDAHLSKPIDAAVFYDTMQRVIAQK